MAAPLKGRVAVVTGATSGIGRWTARALAARGATTVIVGRSQSRAVATAASIASETGNPEVFPFGVTDLADRVEAARLATGLLDRYPRVHLLVHNAGAYYHRREVTREGLERTLALNLLAPFIVTTRLLPRLIESAPSRVVFVASAAHRGQHVDFDDLSGDRNYHGYRQYGRSKLEVILLAREFARRLHDLPVTSNAVHPGFVASGFGRANGGGVGLGFAVAEALFGRRPRRAGEDVAFVAADPAFDGITGQYVAHRTVRSGSADSRDMVAALRLYEACALLAKPYV